MNSRRVSFTVPCESNGGDKDSFYIRRNPLFKPLRQNTSVDLEQTSTPVNHDSATDTDTTQINGNKSAGTPSNSLLLDDTAKDSSKQSNSSLG